MYLNFDMKKIIIVTGGAGFLGRHLIRKLLARNYKVTSFSRGRYTDLEEQGVQCIQGSLQDLETLVEAIKGHDAVFHVASKVAMWGKYEDFFETNVKGSQNVLRACQQNNIKSLIYTSTPSVVFADDSIEGADESLPYPKKSFSRYAQTKAIAEKMLLEANSQDLKIVSLRPHLIFGPGDQNLIPRLVQSAVKGKLKIIGDGKNLVDVIYVENAADAHLCALDKLCSDPKFPGGRAYFIGQGPVELWPFINEVLRKHDVAPIKKKVSFKLAFFIGQVVEMILSIFRVYNLHPPMTRFVALQLAKSHFFSHAQAQEDLDWQPRVTVEEALSNLPFKE